MCNTCHTCRYHGRGIYNVPCSICEKYSHWQEPIKPEQKDATQCWLELVALYDYQLRCNEGADEEYYEMKMEQFKDILSQFRNAVANEEREECW